MKLKVKDEYYKGGRRMFHFLKPFFKTQELGPKMSYSSRFGTAFALKCQMQK